MKLSKIASGIVCVLGIMPMMVQAECTQATIKGSYGFEDAGTRLMDNKTVSYSAVRTANFDGTGKHEGSGWVSINGEFVGYTVKGTYKVNSDCTFTLEATQSYADKRPDQPYKQFGVIVRGGKEILELQTTDNKNQTGKYQMMDNY